MFYELRSTTNQQLRGECMSTTIQDTVQLMKRTSEQFEKAANDPRNYNTEFAYYLEQISHDIYKDAKRVEEFGYLFGGF